MQKPLYDHSCELGSEAHGSLGYLLTQLTYVPWPYLGIILDVPFPLYNGLLLGLPNIMPLQAL